MVKKKLLLSKHKYPASKPISTDFLNEVYEVADIKYHKKITDLFMN